MDVQGLLSPPPNVCLRAERARSLVFEADFFFPPNAYTCFRGSVLALGTHIQEEFALSSANPKSKYSVFVHCFERFWLAAVEASNESEERFCPCIGLLPPKPDPFLTARAVPSEFGTCGFRKADLSSCW